jgi:hypothetical protein
MSDFSETINYHPDRIMSSVRSRKSGDKVHAHFFPFPYGYLQRLQQSGRALVLSFNFLADITSGDKEGNIPLHSMPPKGVF